MMRGILSAGRLFWRHGGGVAIIEFAILLPVILALFLGVFEGARMMWVRNSIQSATEQAARYAMANTTATNADIKAVASAYYQGVGTGAATFTVSRETTNEMEYVTVTGAYTFDYLSSFLDFGGVTLTGKARVPLVS